MRTGLTIAILLAGCVGEPVLQPVGNADDLNAGPTSPWDDLSEAGGPELLLGVAWHGLDLVDGSWAVGPLRYSIVDRDGVVRVDFPLPWPAGQVTHLDLDAAADGRLLATAARSDTSPIGPDGYVWRTLRLDANEGSTVEVLRLTDAGTLELPITGRTLAMQELDGAVQVTPDAASEHGLWLLPETPDGRVGDLMRLDAVDPTASIDIFPRDGWLPSGMLAADGGAPEMAWTLQSSPRAPGLAIGLDGGAKGVGQRRLLTWTPDEGLGDWIDLSQIGDLALRIEPSWSPGADAGSALFQRGAATPFCAEPSFVVARASGASEVAAGGDLDCGWSGPLLDPEAPTFAWFGFGLDDGPGHRLRVSHRGVDVLDIGAFTDGVVERPFLLLEAVELTLD